MEKTRTKGFWVIQCRRCGKWGAREVRKSLDNVRYICPYCKTGKKLKEKNQYGISVKYCGPYDDSRTASFMVRNKNAGVKQ